MRVSSSIVLATLIAVGAFVWVWSGETAGRPAAAVETAAPTSQPAPEPTRVRVLTSVAADYAPVVRASGQTEAVRTVEIRAETEGRVTKIGAERGSTVDAGALILQLDEADRRAQLERAKARVEQRRIEYEAAHKLAAKGYQSETKRAQALADYEEARAEQARIQIDLERTHITAPFRAVLDRRPTEIGDYLKIGDVVATLVELDPLRVAVYVPEHDAPAIAEGMTATVRLASGQELPATVNYTAAVADSATRTFRIEAEFANPDNRIGQGMTAELLVTLPTRRSHHVSPAAFLLDDDGRIGVKIVDDEDVARFRKITVLGSDAAGAWIAGLPDTTRIIMVGQQLIGDGEKVTPVDMPVGPSQS